MADIENRCEFFRPRKPGFFPDTALCADLGYNLEERNGQPITDVQCRLYKAGLVDGNCTRLFLRSTSILEDTLSPTLGKLKRKKITYERFPIPEEARGITRTEVGEPVLVPSTEAAWLIGAVAGGGSQDKGKITLYGTDIPVLDKFATIGTELFGIPSDRRQLLETRPGHNKRLTEIFRNSDISAAVGDLGKLHWPQTLEARHSWIRENTNFLWKFLEGFFEMRGGASVRGTYREIMFRTTYPEIADVLHDMLSQLSVKDPQYGRERTAHNNLRGVYVANLDGVKKIATNIQSTRPNLETVLEQMRPIERQLSHNIPPITLAKEWNRIVSQLGRAPTARELDQMNKAGLTGYTRHTYQSRFQTSFQGVVQTLQQIQTEASVLKGSENGETVLDLLQSPTLQHIQAEWEQKTQRKQSKVVEPITIFCLATL